MARRRPRTSYPVLFCASLVAGLSGAGQNWGMTRYHARAVLLLFLLLNLTARWQHERSDVIEDRTALT